jgi:hypothetical protein
VVNRVLIKARPVAHQSGAHLRCSPRNQISPEQFAVMFSDNSRNSATSKSFFFRTQVKTEAAYGNNEPEKE